MKKKVLKLLFLLLCSSALTLAGLILLNPLELFIIFVAVINDIFIVYAEGKKPEKGELFAWWITMYALWRVSVRTFYHITGTDIDNMVEVGLLKEEDLNLPDEELIRKVQGIRQTYFSKYVGGWREELFKAVDMATYYDADSIRREIRRHIKK